jgi:hypothetical protein
MPDARLQKTREAYQERPLTQDPAIWDARQPDERCILESRVGVFDPAMNAYWCPRHSKFHPANQMNGGRG